MSSGIASNWLRWASKYALLSCIILSNVTHVLVHATDFGVFEEQTQYSIQLWVSLFS